MKCRLEKKYKQIFNQMVQEIFFLNKRGKFLENNIDVDKKLKRSFSDTFLFGALLFLLQHIK
jgi:hypothetical protein